MTKIGDVYFFLSFFAALSSGFGIVAGGHFGGGGLGQQALGLADPVVLLDAAAERQRLVDVGDVIVGEVGDLLELDDAEAVEPAGQLGVEALDLRSGYPARPSAS